jgi:D-beta-D-heptose 7-phosphate kinase/D-beta-D-heptose 1-phosphate adenosyltransferase
MSIKIIALSGGMDPIHIGHIRMINAAARYGKVIVFLNSDAWLIRKKGSTFMPFDERKEILMNIKNVHNVFAVDDSDGTVCSAIKKYKPEYFGNGGDRTKENTPEQDVCEELGVELVWGLGGPKIQSSSKLTGQIK